MKIFWSYYARWWLSGLAVALVVLALVLSDTTRFDSSDWKDQEKVWKGARLEMVDDLIERGLLDRMSSAEVVALLGNGPPTEYFNGREMVYWLGPERGTMSIDSEWLVVRFDEEGRVSDYQLMRD